MRRISTLETSSLCPRTQGFHHQSTKTVCKWSKQYATNHRHNSSIKKSVPRVYRPILHSASYAEHSPAYCRQIITASPRTLKHSSNRINLIFYELVQVKVGNSSPHEWMPLAISSQRVNAWYHADHRDRWKTVTWPLFHFNGPRLSLVGAKLASTNDTGPLNTTR